MDARNHTGILFFKVSYECTIQGEETEKILLQGAFKKAKSNFVHQGGAAFISHKHTYLRLIEC